MRGHTIWFQKCVTICEWFICMQAKATAVGEEPHEAGGEPYMSGKLNVFSAVVLVIGRGRGDRAVQIFVFGCSSNVKN